MTRFFLSFVALIALSITFSSCKKVVGTGPVISEDRTVSDFNSISLAMDATVNITQDSFYKVEVLAQNNVMDEILTNVSGSRLIIQHKNNVYIKSRPVTINISMPDISGLNVSGSGAIRLQNLLLTGNIDMNVSGSGDIKIPAIEAEAITSTISGSGKITVTSGKSNTLNSRISGSGDADLLNVQINSVTTTTSGSGTTKIYAVNNLFAKISGSGDVYYRGNPSIESEISGSGRLIRQ